MSIGRLTNELELGVAANTNNIVNSSEAGDVILKATGSSKVIIMLVLLYLLLFYIFFIYKNKNF